MMDDFCLDCKRDTCDCLLKFNHWISNGEDWYWVVNNLGKIIWSSPQCEGITGYSSKEIIGKKTFDFVPKRDRMRVMGFLENVSTNFVEYTNFEMIYETKDGREVYISTSGSPIFKEDGTYFGYRGVTKDITAIKTKQWELSESKKLWDRAQEAIKIASWEWNLVTDKMYYSHEIFNLFEVEKDDVKENGHNVFMDRMHPEDYEMVLAANHEIKKKKSQKTIEFRLLFPDGRIKYCKESLESIANDFGDVTITTGVLQDITQLHNYHNELNRKIKFEHYIAKIAERFVMVKEHKKTIESVLAEIGELTGSNRTYIFEFDYKTATFNNTYEWCDPYTVPYKASLQDMPIEILAFWFEEFKKKGYIRINNVEEIPDSRKRERDNLKQQSITSLVACPIFCEDELWGLFGLDNTKGKYAWDQETFTLIKVFTQIMQSFLEKKRADGKVEAVNKALESTVENRTHDLQLALAKKEETQAHFDLALNVSDIGVWFWDFENDVVPECFSFSKYFKNVEKNSRSDLHQSSLMLWEQSVHPDHMARVLNDKVSYIEGLKTEYSIDYKVWLDSRNDWRWINSTGFIASKDKNGNPKVMVGTYKDITESKENELILKNAKKSAEKQVKYKAEFLSNLNHELRTPLTIILGNSESLMYTDMDKELKGFIKTIHRAASQLLEIIEDIVDISKVDEGNVKADIVEIQTAAFFEDLLTYYSELTDNAGLQFIYEMSDDFPETFRTDPKMFKKVCNNIVGNAVKFTKKGYVKLLVESEETEYIITVSDTGIGIPEEKQDIIFERFTQADSSSRRRYGGTGLGLAIAKSAIDILEGRIELESESGKGSIFKIYIPIKK
jgi:PAS domain S-box-containing protein